jgi:hypothetical protein
MQPMLMDAFISLERGNLNLAINLFKNFCKSRGMLSAAFFYITSGVIGCTLIMQGDVLPQFNQRLSYLRDVCCQIYLIKSPIISSEFVESIRVRLNKILKIFDRLKYHRTGVNINMNLLGIFTITEFCKRNYYIMDRSLTTYNLYHKIIIRVWMPVKGSKVGHASLETEKHYRRKYFFW